MSCSEVVNSLERTVRPSLNSVSPEDISAARTAFAVPNALVDVWQNCGYGFFVRDSSGNRLTEAANLLLHPDLIADLKGAFASYEDDPFQHGVPFFNTLDREHLVVTPDGSVAYAGRDEPVVVASSLEAFFDSLMDDPEFYDRIIANASPSG